MVQVLSVPITNWTLPSACGTVGYEGDVNATRLEFTGAEETYDYKLDFQRIGFPEKSVVDLQREGTTLYVDFDRTVSIPAGTYYVQLRTVGDTVIHTNKSTLIVEGSINALDGFHPVNLTEAAQIEARITALYHDAEGSAAMAQEHAETATASAASSASAAEQANAAQQAAASAQTAAAQSATDAQAQAEMAATQVKAATAQAQEAALQAQKAADYTNAYSKSEMDQLLSQCAAIPAQTRSGILWHTDDSVNAPVRSISISGNTWQASGATPSTPRPIERLAKGSVLRLVKKNLFNYTSAFLYRTPSTTTGIATDETVKITAGKATRRVVAVIPVCQINQLAGQTLTLSYELGEHSDNVSSVKVYPAQLPGKGTSLTALSSIDGVVTIGASNPDNANNIFGVCFDITGNGSLTPEDYATVKNIQVEFGDTATAYEPYQQCGHLTVPCDLIRVGTKVDTWDPLTGVVVHRANFWNGDGIKNYFISFMSSYNNRAAVSLKDGLFTTAEVGELCTHFACTLNAYWPNTDAVGFCLNSVFAMCKFGSASTITTLDLANEWLETQKLSLTYPLAEATTETYEPQELVLPGGTCTLLCDGLVCPSDITIAYQQDLASYVGSVVDEKTDALATRVSTLETQVAELSK